MRLVLQLIFILCLTTSFILPAHHAHAVRIKDLASVKGVRNNQLIGFGLVVGLAMVLAMTVASSMGVIAPTAFKKLGIDPAIASTPFVQTANDITGILIYFATATSFISYLH